MRSIAGKRVWGLFFAVHEREPVLGQAELHLFFMAKIEIQVLFGRLTHCCGPSPSASLAKQNNLLSKERLFSVFWLVLTCLSAWRSLHQWTNLLDSGLPHVLWLAPGESLHEGKTVENWVDWQRAGGNLGLRACLSIFIAALFSSFKTLRGCLHRHADAFLGLDPYETSPLPLPYRPKKASPVGRLWCLWLSAN